ncbi:755_t:CDS:1 [Cetraspora pellucida]|uniref:755_t:CDS:1 n=1 Tax=Cetraspora pellucida TaxID=1433469 RepID=A0A9N9B1S9_9GLOM|nr:755_t:CDS:1 [Cetraspora pellucida]
MPQTSHSLSKFQYNTTNACDYCKRLKIRCKKVALPDQSTKCNECIKRNIECIYSVQPRRRPIEPNRDSEHKDNELLSITLDILTSTSSLPCPYENISGHHCHMGCIVRYKNTHYN